MGRALVLNAQAKHSLAAIRCLGRHGVQVTAGSAHCRTAGAMSRYADRSIRYPDPETDPEGFLRAVEREVRRHDYQLLLPINEVTVGRVVEHSDRFEPHTNVPFLPYEQLRVGLDKARTTEAARAFDIPQPRTLLPDEVSFDRLPELGYPVVVKPTHGSSRSGVSVCESRGELQRVYRETREEYGPTLLQEFIPNGGERGVYTLYDRSSALCRVTVQERLRSNPPEGGASTYRETVEDPDLVALADDLLSALDWQGVAMAEFRIDARDGEPKLMEINPRFWGSLALSVFAGVAFPYHLYQFATGVPLERDLSYEPGVRARCLFADFQQVLNRDDRVTALREFLTPSQKPCRFDIVSRSDPLPTLGQLLYTAEELLDRTGETSVTDPETGHIHGPGVRDR
jgi:predicted ATP-grasp superfamily ATP-dependent carboligase